MAPRLLKGRRPERLVCEICGCILSGASWWPGALETDGVSARQGHRAWVRKGDFPGGFVERGERAEMRHAARSSRRRVGDQGQRDRRLYTKRDRYCHSASRRAVTAANPRPWTEEDVRSVQGNASVGGDGLLPSTEQH